MKISRRDWNEYSEMLAKLSRLASDEMQTFLDSHGIGNTELIVDVAHALVTKYGEASAAAACNLYDEIAEKQGKAVRSAEPAETASREKTAGAVYGSLKDSPEGKKLKQVPDRLVKQAAADTMLQNAKRDGAEWAWIPSGDGCAMCMTIASRGWLPASSAQLSGGHASHIHANCKCQFAIRFDKNLSVEGYDPGELKRQYDAAEGSGSRQKINYLRRKQYEKKKPYLEDSLKYDNFIKNTEKRIVKNSDVEVAVCCDKYGKELFRKAGTKNMVRFSEKQLRLMKDAVLTHNHPSCGTLSSADIDLFVKQDLFRIRATSTVNTYQLERISDHSKGEAFKKAYRDFQKTNKDKTDLQIKELKKLYKDRKISLTEYDDAVGKVFKNWDRDNNSWLKENSKKYGYRYSVYRPKGSK